MHILRGFTLPERRYFFCSPSCSHGVRIVCMTFRREGGCRRENKPVLDKLFCYRICKEVPCVESRCFYVASS